MKSITQVILIFSMLYMSFLPSSVQAQDFGKNIISVVPVGIYGSDQLSDTYVGFSYERAVADVLSVKIPFSFGLAKDLFQTGLSLKLYPTGSDGAVRYAIAPTILYSTGTDERTESYSSSQGYTEYRDVMVSVRQMSFLLSNSLNATISDHFYIGGELGLGISYFNDPDYESPGFSGPGDNIIANFQFSMGYRF